MGLTKEWMMMRELVKGLKYEDTELEEAQAGEWVVHQPSSGSENKSILDD